MDLDLFFGDVLVGRVCGCYCAEGTWYGDYNLMLQSNNFIDQRLLAFVTFAEDWLDRLNRNINSPPDAAEFDQFSDLMQPKVWQMRSSDGTIIHSLDDAPTIVGGQELCWAERPRGGRSGKK